MTNIISLLGARKVPHWLIKQYYETFRLFNLLWWSFHRVSRKKVYSVRWNCWIFFLFLFFSLFLYICLLRLLGKWLCLRTRNLGYYIHNKIIVFHFRKEEVFIFLSFAQKTPNILGYFIFFFCHLGLSNSISLLNSIILVGKTGKAKTIFYTLFFPPATSFCVCGHMSFGHLDSFVWCLEGRCEVEATCLMSLIYSYLEVPGNMWLVCKTVSISRFQCMTKQTALVNFCS